MSVESDFEGTVMICESYADPYDGFEVDYENNRVVVGEYEVEPLMERGRLAEYLVRRSDGSSYLVWDLDSFFQRVFKWKEYV